MLSIGTFVDHVFAFSGSAWGVFNELQSIQNILKLDWNLDPKPGTQKIMTSAGAELGMDLEAEWLHVREFDILGHVVQDSAAVHTC